MWRRYIYIYIEIMLIIVWEIFKSTATTRSFKQTILLMPELYCRCTNMATVVVGDLAEASLEHMKRWLPSMNTSCVWWSMTRTTRQVRIASGRGIISKIENICDKNKIVQYWKQIFMTATKYKQKRNNKIKSYRLSFMPSCQISNGTAALIHYAK